MSFAPAAAWTVVVVAVVLGLAAVGLAVQGWTRARCLLTLLGPSALVTLVGIAAATLTALLRLPAPEATWSGDARGGDLSQWSGVHAARPEAVRVVTSPVREGYDHALRFGVRPGDFTFGSETEERAEVVAGPDLTRATEGSEQWYAWSMRLDEAPEVPADGFFMVSQWHQDSDRCPPNVALLVVPGPDGPRLRLSVRGGELDTDGCGAEHAEAYDLGPLVLGDWQDVMVRFIWSSDPEQGLAEVYLDGERVLDPVRVATLYDGQGAYLKQGVYRSRSDQALTMHLAGTVRGDSSASVALAGCWDRPPWELLSREQAWC